MEVRLVLVIDSSNNLYKYSDKFCKGLINSVFIQIVLKRPVLLSNLSICPFPNPFLVEKMKSWAIY